ALVDELLRRLYRSQFLGLVGVSGCGKSSLLRAGLMPALETGFLAGAGVQWRIVELRPGNRPIRRLAEALVPVLGSAGTPVGLDCGAVFDAALRRGPLGLSEVLREQEFPAATNLLLVVDQFEEIFRYHRDGEADEAAAFVELVLDVAHQSEFRVFVV